MASWSAGCPNRSTGITAFGLRPSFFAVAIPPFSEFTSMLNVASSTSTNTGVAPSSATTSPVAQKVKDGHSTASPRPTPLAISTINSASVPLAQVTTCLAPLKAASAASSSVTSGPLMNWQWVSTRETASSTDLPRRRRCVARSMKGTGSGRRCWFMEPCKDLEWDINARLADNAARPLEGCGCGRSCRSFQATDRDFKAGDAFIAGHRGHAAGAHRAEERDQFGPQRLIMAHRQMAHRVAAVRLEAEALGHLAGEEIAHHIFAAGGDGDVARLERRQPVGVDMRENARGGAELQERNILALGDGAGKLRLHLHNVRLREPADQIDVVHGEVDHDTDVRHSRRKRSDAGDRDRKNVLARYRCFDGGDGRVETFDMPHHQRHPGAACSVDDLLPLLHRGRDRLFDQDVNLACDAAQCNLVMEVRWRCDRHGIDTFGDQLVQSGEGAAAGQFGGARPMRRQRVDHADQRRIRQPGQHAGMVAAHDAGADDADAKRAFCLGLPARCGPLGNHKSAPIMFRHEHPVALLARSSQTWRMPRGYPGHVLSQKITPSRCRPRQRT